MRGGLVCFRRPFLRAAVMRTETTPLASVKEVISVCSTINQSVQVALAYQFQKIVMK
jgi:hypothetical protein